MVQKALKTLSIVQPHSFLLREEEEMLTYFILRCSLILAQFGASLCYDVYVSVI